MTAATRNRSRTRMCEVRGSQGDKYENYCHLGCDAVHCGREMSTRTRNLLRPSSPLTLTRSLNYVCRSQVPDALNSSLRPLALSRPPARPLTLPSPPPTSPDNRSMNYKKKIYWRALLKRGIRFQFWLKSDKNVRFT
jgi:hypothetical protein